MPEEKSLAEGHAGAEFIADGVPPVDEPAPESETVIPIPSTNPKDLQALPEVELSKYFGET